MMVRDFKRSLLALGIFLVPTVLVKGAAILAGQGGPQSALARGDKAATDAVPPLQPYVAEWPADQLAAAKYIAALREQPFGPSPLLHQVTPKPVINPNIPDLEPHVVPPPNVTVQAILRAAGGNVALINRKRYREGDSLEDEGWIVKTIDPDSRSVLVVHPDTNTEATYTVPLPLR
jgi:hypothetical protein